MTVSSNFCIDLWVHRIITLLAFALDGTVASLIANAEANGVTFSKRFEVSCELKVARPEQIPSEFKALLLNNGFAYSITTTIDDKNQITSTVVTAKRSGVFERNALSSLVQRAEATTSNKPGTLKWSISQNQ